MAPSKTSYESQKETYFNYFEKFIRFPEPWCLPPSLLFWLPSACSPVMISQKALKVERTCVLIFSGNKENSSEVPSR